MMRFLYNLCGLLACVVVLAGCGRNEPELEEKFATVVNSAVTLVEKNEAFSVKDSPVLAFKEQHPEVIELLIVVDKKSRISLIPSGAYKEEIDERFKRKGQILL